MGIIKCKKLDLGYNGAKIISNLSFEIDKGDYLCIVGENGSGKSTLMRTILGLQKPMSGDIEFGESLASNKIGYLPQQTVVQKDFPASVWEVVLSGCQGRCGFKPFYTVQDKTLANQNIEKMEISHLKNKCYRELSGGQQQRVLLARAMCATSEILLLDEPVAGLDPVVTSKMYKLIKKLNDEGITIIMISHDVDAVIDYATHILAIGKNIFFGTKQEYLASGYSSELMKGGTLS